MVHLLSVFSTLWDQDTPLRIRFSPILFAGRDLQKHCCNVLASCWRLSLIPQAVQTLSQNLNTTSEGSTRDDLVPYNYAISRRWLMRMSDQPFFPFFPTKENTNKSYLGESLPSSHLTILFFFFKLFCENLGRKSVRVLLWESEAVSISKNQISEHGKKKTWKKPSYRVGEMPPFC